MASHGSCRHLNCIRKKQVMEGTGCYLNGGVQVMVLLLRDTAMEGHIAHGLVTISGLQLMPLRMYANPF